MQTRKIVSILILVLTVMIISEGYATDKKVTKKDYRFFSGTWVNEEYNSRIFNTKYLIRRDGTFDSYNRTSDTGKHGSSHYVIVDKWTDSEGNIWFKMYTWMGAMVEGHPGAYILAKFSNS